MNKTIIIQGSARGDGNTQQVVEGLNSDLGAKVVKLSDYEIGHFDYNYANSNDDFLPLIENIISNYDTLIFATPVYWYAMSGNMKVFFDRISDLLTKHKELGRKLRDKNMGLVICGSDSEELKEFSLPFKASAAYLGMHFIGEIHTWVAGGKIPDEVREKFIKFSQKIPTFD